jgi:SAM-dependent methyltransferase
MGAGPVPYGSYEQVLDIGCGTGQTIRDAARIAQAASALGVDISAPAIERAREIARAQGRHNDTFERGDAQSHHFPQEYLDLALSRLDPAAATRALGRLRETLAAHLDDDGVWFTSRARIVSARCP